MSYAMRTARQYAVGDPGLFGFLGKAVGSVLGVAGNILPGPAGLLAKAGSSLLTPKPVSVAKAGALSPQLQTVLGMKPVSQPLPVSLAPPGFSGVKVGPIQIGTSKPGIGPAPQLFPGAGGIGVGQNVPSSGFPQLAPGQCQSGYHLNKTRFVSARYGVVEKGTMCVKNRRRNPLNPRALSRAMSRVKSAQKAVRCLQLFAGPAARASSRAGKPGKNGRRPCRGCK